MGCNFEFTGNATSDRQSTNFTDNAQSDFREKALCELRQQAGDPGVNKTVTDAAAAMGTTDQKELEFPNIYNGPITRDIREQPLLPDGKNNSDMVLGIPNGDSDFGELNKLTEQMFDDLLNPKPLTGSGGTLEDIAYDGQVIQIPDDVIDCGFGNLDKMPEIPGAGRLIPNQPEVKDAQAEAQRRLQSYNTTDSQ